MDEVAAKLFSQVDAAVRSMPGDPGVPDGVQDLIDRIADTFSSSPDRRLAGVDPYLGQAFLSALLACEKGVRAADESERRRRVRIGLERVRQALRDIVDEAPASDVRSTRELARWLGESVPVPQAEWAKLLGVTPRTWQRWTSPSGTAAPDGDDARRIRAVARIVAHLRHVFTGPGVLHWFQRPHPDLAGAAPATLLSDPLELPRLTRLAAGVRSTIAS